VEISKYISDENKISKSITILQLTDHLLTYLLEGLKLPLITPKIYHMIILVQQTYIYQRELVIRLEAYVTQL
jgi:hypothetical protein